MVAGDTLSDIAGAYGVTVAELDAANGLGGSTVIVPGQVLVIRRVTPVVAVASVNVPLTDEMRGNARIIIDVGRALGVPDQGIVIALAAAAQESGLQNLHHGDLDSLGLFQQRPTEGWGTVEEVLDPVRATTAFFGGAAESERGPHQGSPRHPGLGGDDAHAGGAGRAAVGASRPLRQVGGLGARLAVGAGLTGARSGPRRGIRRSRRHCDLAFHGV